MALRARGRRATRYLGTEPEGGTDHPWKKGDIIVVDHFLWHQHFNDDPEKTAKVVRIHMFDSLLETMRVLMDPMVLFEEPPEHIRDAQAGDITHDRVAGGHQADMAVTGSRRSAAGACRPGCCPCTPCPRITTTGRGTTSSRRPAVKERLLKHALLTLRHGRRWPPWPGCRTGW